MNKTGINLQDSFLNQVRKDNAPIELILLDGSRLNGLVRGFDNFTVILQTGNDQHLIYKHAIAQIIHQRGNFRPMERENHFSHHAETPRTPRPQAPQPPTQQLPQPPQPPQQPPQPPRAPDPKADKNKFNTLNLNDVKID